MNQLWIRCYHNKTKHNKTTSIFRGIYIELHESVNSLRPRQNGRYFADEIFKCIFLNENVWIPIKISLKFVSKVPINDIPALVQIMAWRRPGDKPLSEPMMVSLLTHICVTRPQWVNTDNVTMIRQSTTKQCWYSMGYTPWNYSSYGPYSLLSMAIMVWTSSNGAGTLWSKEIWALHLHAKSTCTDIWL